MSLPDDPPEPDPAEALVADACHLRVPSEPAWIGPTVDYLVGRAIRCGAVPAARGTKLTVALHEALTNAVVHGNLGISSELKERGDDEFFAAVAARLADPAHARRVVDVRMDYDGSRVCWVLHDQGAGFDATAALRKLDEEEPDVLKPSGRGLLLMRAFTDQMKYEDGGRKLTLVAVRDAAEDRRGQPRWPTSVPVQVAPLSDDGEPLAGCDAVGRNVSDGGMAFLSGGEPPTGRVRLTLRGREGPVEVDAEVRHWKPLEGNLIEVGCRFETPAALSPVPSGELSRLIERLCGRSGDERRTSQRLPFGGRVEVLLPGGEARMGFGRDLSRGGIAFWCAGPVPEGEVRLRLAAGGGEPVVVRAVVLRATKLIEGFYDVGARFVPG